MCLTRRVVPHVVSPTPTTPPHNRAAPEGTQMEVVVKDCADNLYVIEVGVDDTMETMRQKVASAVGLAEDSFCMGFGGKDEGDDIRKLSAGDTITLGKVKKFEAIAELHALGETDIRAERLENVEDPKVACLLLQAEVATVIPDKFLMRGSLTSLDLSAVSVVTQIGNDFLSEAAALTNVDLSGLSSVTRIGGCFLHNCGSLTAANLSSLGNVTDIGIGFFCDCMSLTKLDLSALSKLSKIESCFLASCGNLAVLNLPPLNRVTQVDGHFLSECRSLKALRLPSLSSATRLGDCFLLDCSALATLDLPPLSSVTHIGKWFLGNCESLTELRLPQLSGVTRICDSFLRNCKSLTTLDLTQLDSITRIEGDFLSACVSLTKLDLSPLSGVRYIGMEFLNSCIHMATLDLTPLSGVTEIGDGEYFLRYCTGLTALDVPRNTVVWSTVKQGKLSHLLVEPGAKRGSDESPEQRKRKRLAQLTDGDDGDVSS